MKRLAALGLALLLTAALTTGCTGEAGAPTADQPEDSVTYQLYFADKTCENLVTEEATFTPGDDLGKRLVEALIAGPVEEEHNALFPPETTVNEVSYLKADDGKYIAVVDFGSGVLAKSYGSSMELMAIYSVVNTLTQLENVKYVRFTIDGKERETLWGHCDLSETYTAKEDIWK